jgi:small subunit ribosomal protein S20
VLHCLAVANIQSQIKRNRQNERRRLRNKAVRTRLKTEAKKARTLAEEGDLQAAQEQVRATARNIDRAAARGVLHPRTAARQKSRLARQIAAGASPEAG